MSKHALNMQSKNRKWINNICSSLNPNCTCTFYNTKHKYQHNIDQEMYMHPINSCQSLVHCWIVKHLDTRLGSVVYVAIDMWLSPLLTSITLVAFSCNISVVESVVLFPDPELSFTPPDGVRFPSDLFGALGSLTPNIVDPTRTLVLPSSICKKK